MLRPGQLEVVPLARVARRPSEAMVVAQLVGEAHVDELHARPGCERVTASFFAERSFDSTCTRRDAGLRRGQYAVAGSGRTAPTIGTSCMGLLTASSGARKAGDAGAR